MRETLERSSGAFWLSALLAGLGTAAIGIEAVISLQKSFGQGKGVAEALFLFLRFFTILTNIFAAALMGRTACACLRRRPWPGDGAYASALVYLVVVGATYEALLRRLWSPRGLQFFSDMALHDIIPVLTLVFWLGFAPKAALRARDAARWLAFPAVYFVVILAGGALGEGYPYGFLDAAKLGVAGITRNAALFLIAFYGLGLAAVAIGRCVARRQPWAADNGERFSLW